MLTPERAERINKLMEEGVLSRELSEFSSKKGVIASVCCDDPRFLGCFLFTLTRIPLVHVMSLHGAALSLITKSGRFEHERGALLNNMERAIHLSHYHELLFIVHDHCKMAEFLGVNEPDELINAAKNVTQLIERELPIKVHVEMQVYPPGATPICFTENPPKFARLRPDNVIEVLLEKRFEIYRIVR